MLFSACMKPYVRPKRHAYVPKLMPTWTPKVCQATAQNSYEKPRGALFHIILGFRYRHLGPCFKIRVPLFNASKKRGPQIDLNTL